MKVELVSDDIVGIDKKEIIELNAIQREEDDFLNQEIIELIEEEAKSEKQLKITDMKVERKPRLNVIKPKPEIESKLLANVFEEESKEKPLPKKKENLMNQQAELVKSKKFASVFSEKNEQVSLGFANESKKPQKESKDVSKLSQFLDMNNLFN